MFELCILPISLEIFLNAFKAVKPRCRKGKKTDPSNDCPVPFIQTLANIIERASMTKQFAFKTKIALKLNS